MHAEQRASVIGAIVLSMRPRQWTKNLAIFVALVFSRGLRNGGMVTAALTAFSLFCLLTGAVYILNDLIDIESDKNHPVKANRPIASGAVPAKSAWIAFAALTLVAIGGSFWVSVGFGAIASGYCVLQLAYTLALKHVVIVDVFCIAAGFFLRVIAGACAVNVSVSSWLLVCTFFMSLFLALGKRRHEIVLLEDNGSDHRKVLAQYDVLLLDQMMSVVTASSVVAYSVYTLAPETVEKFGTTNLKYTIPFVLYGIYRYLYLVYHRKQGGSPESIVLQDMPLVVDISLYCLVVLAILYARQGWRIG
jgi:4-hydroxybenzoate polyprenyltransferase